MPRSGVVGTYTLPPGTDTQAPNTTISSSMFNGAMDDIEQTFNTATPVAYGGTGATTTTAARTNLSAEPTLLSEVVLAAPQTAIDFTGLDITAHKSYRIEAEIINGTASGSNIVLFANGDYAGINYASRSLLADAGGVTTAAFSGGVIASVQASASTAIVMHLTKTFFPFARADYTYSSAPVAAHMAWFWNNNANITSLRLIGSVANIFGSGTRVRIYRGDK